MTNHDLSLEISALRDLVVRLGRGTYDTCDPALLHQLKNLAEELQSTVEVTQVTLQP